MFNLSRMLWNNLSCCADQGNNLRVITEKNEENGPEFSQTG